MRVGDCNWQSEGRFMKLTRANLWGISQAGRANFLLDLEAKWELKGGSHRKARRVMYVHSTGRWVGTRWHSSRWLPPVSWRLWR